MKKALLIANAASMIHLFNEENIKLLAQRGYEVHVACNFIDGNTTSPEVVEECKRRWTADGIICHQVSFMRTPFSLNQFKIYNQIREIIKENKFDIIHCHTPITSILTRIAAKKYRRQGTKVVYTAHGFHFYNGASLTNWLFYFTSEWICSFFTDVLITINGEDFKRAKKCLHAKKTEYIPGVGIDLYNIVETNVDREEKLKEFGITDETVLLSVGELNDNKNHETIIKALSKIDKPYKYIICGRGYKEQYLKDLAEKLGIKEKVIFAGFRSDVKELMPCADIFCFPSYREGLSLSLMEAMASGLPIVASKIRGNVDLVDDNKGGFLCAPGDYEGFYKSIVRLMEIPDIMKGFGEYNLEKIQNFTKEIVAEKMSEYYFFDERENGFLYERQGTQINA